MNQLLLNDPVDVEWVRDVHLPKDAPTFKSCELHGSEDAPDRILIYGEICPTIFDTPIRVFVRNSTGYLT